MALLFKKIRQFLSKHEFIKAGIYISFGAVISIQFIEHPGLSSFVPITRAAEYPTYDGLQPPNRLNYIQGLDLPQSSQLRFHNDYVSLYDRRNRIPYWVFEHIRPDRVQHKNKDPNLRVKRSVLKWGFFKSFFIVLFKFD